MIRVTIRAMGLVLALWIFAIQVAAQSPSKKWKNGKNEEVFSYRIKCVGNLYSGSKYTKWEVVLNNLLSKTVKCEAVVMNKDNQEISEAVEVVISGEKEARIIFLRVTGSCDESVKLNFNHVLYRKNKRGF